MSNFFLSTFTKKCISHHLFGKNSIYFFRNSGEHELRKHNGLERLKLVLRESEREGECMMCSNYCYELKIKFAFYDLLFSFPVRRFVFLFIYLFFFLSLLKLLSHFSSLSLSIGRSLARSLNRLFAFSDYLLMRANARIPNFATAKTILIDQNFWAHHICNYEIKDKQTRSALHTHAHNDNYSNDWIRRKSQRNDEDKTSPCFKIKIDIGFSVSWFFFTIHTIHSIEFLYEL